MRGHLLSLLQSLRAMSRWRWVETLPVIARILLLIALYASMGEALLSYGRWNNVASLFWPPTGLALSWLVRWGWINLLGAVAGAWLIAVNHFDSPGLVLFATAGQTLGPLLGAAMLRWRTTFRPALDRPSDLLYFFLSAIVVATTCWLAALALTTLPGALRLPGAGLLAWWWSNFVGVLIVAPVLLTCPQYGIHTILGRASALELATFVLCLAAVFTVSIAEPFAGEWEQVLLALTTAPLLAYAAWRLGPWFVAGTSALLMLAASELTAALSFERTLTLNLLVTSCHGVSLFIAAALVQRTAAKQSLTTSREELRRTTQRFEFLLSATAAISYSFDLPGFRTTFISDNINHVLGWRARQFLDDPQFFFDLLHPDDRSAIPADSEEYRRQEFHVLEYRLRNTRGEYRWMRDNLRVIHGADGQPCECIGSIVDITDRRVSEEKLLASEQHLRTILDGTAAFIALLDREGRLLDVNDAPLQATQQKREDIIGQFLWETYGWSYSQAAQQHVRSMFERASRGEFVCDDFDIITHDGRMLTLEGRMVPLYKGQHVDRIVGSAIDVTERKQVERALRASEQRLRLLLETATLTASTLDLEYLLEALMQRFGEVIPMADVGTIYLFDEERRELFPAACRGFDNEAHQQLRLLPGESTAGKVFQRGDSVRTTSMEHLQCLRGSLRPENEALFARVRGQREIISTIATPLRTPGGEMLGVITMSSTTAQFAAEDLAFLQGIAAFAAMAVQNARSYQQEKQYAVELEQTVALRTAELRKANQELEAFVHTVAHDLRAPLRAMHGFAQALEEDHAPRLGENGRQYTQQIVDAAQRMDRLIQDLLVYSRIGLTEAQLVPVPLSAVLEEAQKLVRGEFAESTLQFDIRPLPTVRGHRSVLVQVFVNLLGNAVKFIPEGATPQVRVWAEQRHGMWRVWVADNGIGIAAENQDRIFRVFERLHGIEQYPGTGIGLAIVKRACRSLGGACGLESDLGVGSRFWIELPDGATP